MTREASPMTIPQETLTKMFAEQEEDTVNEESDGEEDDDGD